jgi:hypothetical protein
MTVEGVKSRGEPPAQGGENKSCGMDFDLDFDGTINGKSKAARRW